MNTKVAKIPTNVIEEIQLENSINFESEETLIQEKTIALSCLEENKKIKNLLSKTIKRCIDILAGLIGTILLIPLTMIIYVINKIYREDDGPIFFLQERIGKDGKLFKMIKFRTMCVDADEKLEKFLKENQDVRKEFYIYRKIKNDPRVTRIGKILRQTSLDEFPQFLHLLTGKMSLVGPRPYLPREKEDMGEYYKIITKYKPGITGLWQIGGRSEATFEDRLNMDINYHKNHSNVRDLSIVLKTINNVIKKEGAI